MFIVAEHIITNPNAFFEARAKIAQTWPKGVKRLQAFPSVSRDRAVCLWEAESPEKLKAFLEPVLGPCSRNTYYAVDTKEAVGLPTIAAAAA